MDAQAPNGHGSRIEELLQSGFKIPFGARNAAEKIQAQRTVLGKRVTGEMGFSEQAKAGDAAGAGKLMPLRFADRPQLHARESCRWNK